MNKANPKTPKKVRKKYAKSTAETKASNARRETTVEKHDKSQHPVDQSFRGWNFKDWLNRPAGTCELSTLRGGYLTEEVAVHVGRMLGEGLYQYHVESLLGLSERAISNWCYSAKKHAAKRKEWVRRRKRFETRAGAIESLGPKPPITIQMNFAKIVRKSEAIGETTLFGALIKYALKGDAKTAMWILERKYPERYGRLSMRTDIETDDEGKPKINPIMELAEALNHVAERVAE